MRRLSFLLILLAAGGGGAYWWFVVRPAAITTAATNAPTAAEGGARRGGRGGGGPQTVPVLVQDAATRDVPIYLDGLGTAQASATVTVHTQVDGTLQEVRFIEGQDVHVGDILARIDPRTYQAALDLAVAKKQQDLANLANARVDLVRYQKLVSNSYTSAQQADTQKALVAQLEAQVAQDQAQIDTARAQLSYTTIASPIDGRTGIRQVDAGNIVHASDTNGIVVVATLKPISVIFSLPQQNLAAVTAAMQAGVPEVLALPQGGDDSSILDHGTLAVLDNQVDQSTGTIKLKATFPNAALRLWPGAFVTVRVKVDVKHDATVVPPVAVLRGPRGPYLYVVGADLVAHRRDVKVGHEDQVASIITDGVQVGDRVVVDGASRLSDGSKVTIVSPPGAPAAAPDANRPRRRPDGGARPAAAPGTASRARTQGAT